MASERVCRIGILELPGASSYGPMTQEMLERARKRGGAFRDADVSYRIYDVAGGEMPAADDIEAAIITGSAFGAYEDIPWIHALEKWIRVVHAAKKPLVGICFGHQIIAKAFGCTVSENPAGFELGTMPLHLDARTYKKVMRRAPPEDGPCVSLYYCHNDAVVGMTGDCGLSSLGGTEMSAHNALRGDGLMTWQGHPEFDMSAIDDAVNSLSSNGVLPARLPDGQTLEECYSLFATERNDGELVGSAIFCHLVST